MNAAVFGNMARGLWSDLREKRLWPLALVLALALVAVPVLLSHSAASAPAGTPVAGGAGTGGGIPAVSVQSGANGRLYGHGRDPFGQSSHGQSAGAGGTAASGSGASSTASTGSAAGTGAASTTAAGSGGGSGTAAASTVATGPAPAGGAPPPPLPPSKPAPAPTGLSSTDAYRVAVSATDASGGVHPVDPVVRLSGLPSSQQPLVVELGVLQGGDRVLFAVAPGTTLRGPGSCIPGPIDCEVVSLATNQTESLATSGNSAPAAQFAVTGISAQGYGSAAAANDARRAVSVAGLASTRQWNLPALSLFDYEASLGALVDQRNLAVGG